MTLDELSAQAKDFSADYGHDLRRAWAGLEEKVDLERVFEKYPALYAEPQIQLSKKKSQSKTAEAERWKRLHYFCADVALARSTARQEDRLQNELAATRVLIDGKAVPFFNLRPALLVQPNAKKREEIFAKETGVVRRTNKLRKAAVEGAQSQLQKIAGTASATTYLNERKSFDHNAFLELLQEGISQTSSLYEKHMGAWVKDELKQPLGEIAAAHKEYLRKMPQFDEWFPGADLMLVCRQSLENLGLDLQKLPQIHVDDAQRPLKNPRAVCIAINPPEEVHLIIKPAAGSDDYHQFMHEAGHALHFAHTDPDLPFEQRSLGYSNALTEIYSFLIESLISHPDWLRQYLGFGEELAWQVSYYSKLVDLLFFRRYVGKLEYELLFNEAPTDWRGNGRRYSEILTRNTGFLHEPSRFLEDMDGGLYSADYLRAWITAAQLRAYLTNEYGEKWFLEARAGEFLKRLWAKGQSIENEDVSSMIGQKPLDASALLGEYHSVLTSNPI